jgi:hypothetical protein
VESNYLSKRIISHRSAHHLQEVQRVVEQVPFAESRQIAMDLPRKPSLELKSEFAHRLEVGMFWLKFVVHSLVGRMHQLLRLKNGFCS